MQAYSDIWVSMSADPQLPILAIAPKVLTSRTTTRAFTPNYVYLVACAYMILDLSGPKWFELSSPHDSGQPLWPNCNSWFSNGLPQELIGNGKFSYAECMQVHVRLMGIVIHTIHDTFTACEKVQNTRCPGHNGQVHGSH